MASRIPRSFIDELLTRVDIVELIDARVPLRRAGRNYQARCPFHSERTPSFSVSPDKQFYYCFGCGASGSALGFLMDYERLPFPEAVEELASMAGMEVPREPGQARRRESLQPLYEVLAGAERHYARQLREHPAAGEAVDYLKRRGLSGGIAARYGLGFAPPGWDNLLRALGGGAEAPALLERAGLLVPREGGGHYDRFRHRIMFPIRDQRGRVIGFGGRVLGDEEPKYLNSPETPVFHKGRELYGLFEARRTEASPACVLVVEGYMDVLALAQFGVNNAVATLGTATTTEHLERLFRVAGEVVFCFDGDAAGRRAAWRALENALPLLGDGRQASFLFMPEGEDPDTMVRRAGPEGFQSASGRIPASDFLFSSLLEQVDRDTDEGRARLASLARPLLERLPADAFRHLMFRRLSSLTRLAPAELGVETPAAPRGRQQAPRPPAGDGRRLSLVARALQLLLHYPALGTAVQPPQSLSGHGPPGSELLLALLELCRAQPGVPGGALIEHWRDSPHHRPLARLLSRELPLSEAQAQEEFRATLEGIGRQAARRELAALPDSPSELKTEAKAALRQRLMDGAKSRRRPR